MTLKQPRTLTAFPALALLGFAAFTTPAAAQIGPIKTSHDLYAGYSYSFQDYGGAEQDGISGGMNGWQGSFKTPLLPGLGLKVDGAGYYKADPDNFNPHTYFLLAGPELSHRFGKSRLFVHGLVGLAHLGSSNSLNPLQSNFTFAAALGGGLDHSLTRHIGWRVTGDFLRTNFNSSDNQIHGSVPSNGRISTGPVLRF